MRDERQKLAFIWATQAFGEAHVNNRNERGLRFLEESLELYQSIGCERELAHKLVDFVFDRPSGNYAQEIGGVGITLLVLCEQLLLSADACEQNELARVIGKPYSDFAKRNTDKVSAGFGDKA